jgi:ribonuclease HI
MGVTVKRDSGDLAYALRLLASGQSLADASKEAGFTSRKSLAELIYELSEKVESGTLDTRAVEAARAGGAEASGARTASGKAPGGKGRGGKSGKGASRGKSLSLIAYSDGASVGNPGEAGCGALLVDESGEVLLEDYRYLGRATNNVAEYEGAILALKLASKLGAGRVELRVDSDLLANQIAGRYKVKSRNLAALYEDLKEMTKLFDDFSVTRIGREENKQADRLANLAVSSRKRR